WLVQWWMAGYGVYTTTPSTTPLGNESWLGFEDTVQARLERAGTRVRAGAKRLSDEADRVVRAEGVERGSVQLAMFAWVNVKRLVKEVFTDRTSSESHLVIDVLGKARFGHGVNLANHLPGLTAAQNLAAVRLVQQYLPHPTLDELRTITAQIY